MVDSAFESWWFIFLKFRKILVIRTHPEELHVVKCALHTHISTHYSPHWGQHMSTKCYVDRQGCSYDFQRWKVWPFDVPKPCQTSSQDVPSPLIKPPFRVKKPVWCIGITHGTAFETLSKAYVSRCRSTTKRPRNMVDSAFESWWFIFLSSTKISVIRTHPRELHVVKCAFNTQTSTHFCPQWGQQMLTKCYL